MRITRVLVAAAAMGAVAIALPAAAATGPTAGRSPLWAASWNSDGHDTFASVDATSPDGSTVYSAGEVDEPTNRSIGKLFAYQASSGAVRWQRTFKPFSATVTTPVAITVSPDGATLYLSSYIVSASGTRYTVISAYSAATGTVVWQDKAANSNPAGNRGLVLSADGATLYQSGYNYTAAYDTATGARIWLSKHPKGGSNLALSPDGSTLYVTGQGVVQPNNVTALKASTGATLWSKSIAQAYWSGLGVSPDGATVYTAAVGGFKKLPFRADATLPKHPVFAVAAWNAATGALRWLATTTAPSGSSLVTGLTVNPDGSAVYVLEEPTNVPTTKRSLTVRAVSTTDGHTLWSRTVSGTQSGSQTIAEAPNAVINSAGTALYVGGDETIATAGSYQWFAVAYSTAAGSTLWNTSYDANGQVEMSALSPDGSRLFITGLGGGQKHITMDTAAYGTS